jgi:Mg-chelatase subunit ChlD
MTPYSLLGLAFLLVACGGSDDGSSGTKGDGGKTGADDSGEGSTPSIDVDLDNGGRGNGTAGNGNICDSITLKASSTPPRVVFVQDLSSSMIGRWQPLDDAMVSIAQDYGERIQLGMIPFSSVYLDHFEEIEAASDEAFTDFFSANDNDCDISDSSIILPKLDNADAVVAAYDKVIAARMVGGTPTYLVMEKTREVLIDQAPDDGSLGYAILVTDGEPNCPSPTGDSLTDVETAILALAADNVDTYVVGYQYGGEVLDSWAAAGNTKGYYDAEDTSDLNAAISSILSGLVPCEYALSQAVEDPEFVRVTIDGTDRPLDNAADGWKLGPDQKTVILTGAACTDLRSDDTHTINVVVECEEVIVGPK